MTEIGQRARAAGRILATAPAERKNLALREMAAAVRAATPDILAGNQVDLAAMTANGQAASFLDRGTLDAERIEAIAQALEAIVALDDPVGSVIASWERPNGLKIERVRTPLGVIGVIYESRPNVTADAGALCLKAGNAVVLRGGSDTIRSNRAIHAALQKGLEAAGLPADAIQIVPVTDRAAVGEMLRGLDGNLDVIVPRGGRSLVERVQSEARVPVFAHLEGLVHIFVDKAADLEKSVEIVVNSKLRRTGICGALETLLVHEAVAHSHLPVIVRALQDKGCEIRGGAREDDWSTEYLDKILSVKVVADLDAAMDHIARYGSSHTDCIL
ncbi:UNVERIFIED_CONTAM: hypothetical protein GTU68_051849, partial [Idotea baltica]|nr:hypothetical protein [Idotea baltica]